MTPTPVIYVTNFVRHPHLPAILAVPRSTILLIYAGLTAFIARFIARLTSTHPFTQSQGEEFYESQSQK